MKYDFYFSQTQKDMDLTFFDEQRRDTFINGVEYTECAVHGTDMTKHSGITDYVFICTEDDSKITFN